MLWRFILTSKLQEILIAILAYYDVERYGERGTHVSVRVVCSHLGMIRRHANDLTGW